MTVLPYGAVNRTLFKALSFHLVSENDPSAELQPQPPPLPLPLKRQNALWGTKLLEALNTKGHND